MGLFRTLKIVINGMPSNSKKYSLKIREFKVLRDYILEEIGVFIPDKKILLLENRIGQRLLALNLDNFSNYIELLDDENFAKKEKYFLINAVTTNKTDFFREEKHFDFLKETCKKDFLHSNVYIWSAACSTGEEIYSLAMTLDNLKESNSHFDYKILATDINVEVLNFAKKAIYSNLSDTEIPALYILNYFDQISESESLFKVKTKLTNNVKFRRHNLMDMDESTPLKFNFIFLRNVLIYFQEENIGEIINFMTDCLIPGGYLILGMSESLDPKFTRLKLLGKSIYQKIA